MDKPKTGIASQLRLNEHEKQRARPTGGGSRVFEDPTPHPDARKSGDDLSAPPTKVSTKAGLAGKGD